LVEFGVSAVVATYLLTQLEEFPNHLLWVYLPTALGGLILNYLFFVSGLVPRAIAILGLLGYGMLLLTVPLDLLSVIDVEKGAGLLLLAAGGLYEFHVLPAWLIARDSVPPARRDAACGGEDGSTRPAASLYFIRAAELAGPRNHEVTRSDTLSPSTGVRPSPRGGHRSPG
jgi:hypothetical protein